MRVRAADTLKSIKRQRAVIKMIGSKAEDLKNWNFILKQFQSPGKVRPYRKDLASNANRNRIYNPRTKKWYNRVAPDQRGRNKKTQYIKKTSVSLIPSDGQMKFFNSTLDYGIGLIFNLDDCNLKNEKYVFLENSITNLKWWIENNYNSFIKEGTTIFKLRAANIGARRMNIFPNHNELLISPSKRSIRGVFTPLDTYNDRINVLCKKYLVKKFLKITMPLFIITETKPVKIYTADQQFEDLYVVYHRAAADAGQKLLREAAQSYGESVDKFIKRHLSDNKVSRNTLHSVLLKSIVSQRHGFSEIIISHKKARFTKEQTGQLVIELLKLNKFELAEKLLKKNKTSHSYLSKCNITSNQLLKLLAVMAVNDYQARRRLKNWNHASRQNAINEVYKVVRDNNMTFKSKALVIKSIIGENNKSHKTHSWFARHRLTSSSLSIRLDLVLDEMHQHGMLTVSELDEIDKVQVANKPLLSKKGKKLGDFFIKKML